MMRFIIILIFSVLFARAESQTAKDTRRIIGYSGFGLGLDFGGIGIRGEHIPADWLGIFAGVGYNYEGFGWNAGINMKFSPEAKASPFLTAMFGYNTILIIDDDYVNVYYGISAGGGVEFFMGKNRNKLSLALLIPFRGINYKSDRQYFIDRRYSISDPLPVLLSIGFHFAHYARKMRIKK